MNASSFDQIAVRHLWMSYGGGKDAVVALADIDFHVREGEFVAIVGPSGCGKSTLLRILAGLMPPTEGEAKLAGTPIRGPRRDIGVVFQSPVLFPWRTVLSNVDAAGRRAGSRSQGDARARHRSVEARRARRVRGPVSAGAVRRHAAARRAGARADPRSGAAADGRAVRRARRDDAREHEHRAAAHLDGAAQDRGLHHPLDRRGRVPRRPRAGDDAAAGQDRRRAHDRPAATARARGHEHRNLRRLRSAHPRRPQRRRRAP